jgi:hypothetical protein
LDTPTASTAGWSTMADPRRGAARERKADAREKSTAMIQGAATSAIDSETLNA